MLALLLACSVPRPEPHGPYLEPVLQGVPDQAFTDAAYRWRELGHEVVSPDGAGTIFIGVLPDMLDHDDLGIAVLDNGDCLVGIRSAELHDTIAHEIGHCLGFLDVTRPLHLMSSQYLPGPVMTYGLAE